MRYKTCPNCYNRVDFRREIELISDERIEVRCDCPCGEFWYIVYKAKPFREDIDGEKI